MILEYRKYNKLKNTYVDSLPDLINNRTGRIHTTFNQTIAATGRLSSTNLIFKNIPARTGEGREIRKSFRAKDNSENTICRLFTDRVKNNGSFKSR